VFFFDLLLFKSLHSTIRKYTSSEKMSAQLDQFVCRQLKMVKIKCSKKARRVQELVDNLNKNFKNLKNISVVYL
jgi:hypothetical protein